MGRLDGKVAIVTGAGAGIGRAIARRLAAEGASLVATDIDEAGAAEAIADLGETAIALKHDVSSESDWQTVMDRAIDRFGKLDVLVNNAGVQLTCALEETSLEAWRKVFGVNVEGTFLGTRFAIQQMKQTGGGAIVNLCSTYATMADGLNAAYCSSKAAARHFSKVAALYCAERNYGIRVNAVHPGVIMTPMLEREIEAVTAERGLSDDAPVREEWDGLAPFGIGAPDDIASGVLYLVSDDGKYVTGIDLPVDGGHLIR